MSSLGSHWPIVCFVAQEVDLICQWCIADLLIWFGVGRQVISGLGLPRKGVLPRGFCSLTHGPTACAPTKRLTHMGEGRGHREQYPMAGSAQRGNPRSTEVLHSSSLGG